MVGVYKFRKVMEMSENLRLNFRLLDLVYDSVTVFDSSGRIVYANRAAAESRGYSLDELLDLQMKDLYPKERIEFVRKELVEAITQGERIFEVENLAKGGDVRWFKVKAIPVKIEEQRYILKIGMNVKEKYDRIKAEVQAIERSQKLLEGASRVTSMVRHDLRSPLQSIKNAVHIIRVNPDKTEDMLDVINNATDYASKILSDLRFITNPIAVQRQRFDIIELLEERIKSSIIPINVKIFTDMPDAQKVYMDPTMISRVVDNLIRNAVEAMPEGGNLTISLDVKDNILNLVIEDTGVGISSDNLKNIFQPFYTSKRTGTGLGLYYSKLAVQSHGGRIFFESEEGRGAKFTISLPVNEP